MDFKAFSEEDFDPKDWINKAWAASDESKEVFVANSVAKLQVYIKQLTMSLDDATLQIVRTVPKLLEDGAALASQGRALRERLEALERRAGDVQEETGHSIESLRRIDKLESSLQAACVALRSADKWTKLAAELQDLLENVPTKGQPLADLTQKITDISESLEMLSNSSDYESKRVQLQVMFNRIEAALSVHIVDALTNNNTEDTTAYWRVLDSMGRADSLARYWRGVELARLEEARKRIGEPRALLIALPADLRDHAHAKMEWVSSVIRSKAAVSELIRLYTELVQGLEPNTSRLISSAIKQCGSPVEALNMLIDIRSGIAAFMKSINDMVDSAKEPGSAEMALDLGRMLHADLLANYTEIQLGVLTDQLATINTRLEEHSEAAAALSLCAERCEDWSRAAEASGRRLAGAAAYPYLLPALEALFAELCSRLSARLNMLSSGSWAALPVASAAGQLLLAAKRLSGHLASNIRCSESDPECTEATKYFLTPSISEALKQLKSEEPLSDSVKDIMRICRNLRQLIIQYACEPALQQLDKIAEMGVWKNNEQSATDIPDFSIAPQEYITQVGQYLMTLPQHLEPHLSQREESLSAALSVPKDVDLALFLLNEVCNQTCEVYTEKLRSLGKMDSLGAKRCVTDIAYLSSIVLELGGTVPIGLKNLEQSLRGQK